MEYRIFILSMYLFLFLFLSFLFSFIYRLNIKNKTNSESFQNYINPFFKNKTFCSYDNQNNKCKCVYQKDNINIPFECSDNNCNNKCMNKSRIECEKNTNDKIFYYCQKGNKCKRYEGTNRSQYISTNNCGFDPLTNLLKLPYLDEKSCKKSINVCNSYNDPNLNTLEIKEKCLKNTSCGFCTNKYGEGKCVEGTAEGPLDLTLFCTLNNNDKNNKYEYGNFQFMK